MENLRHGNQYLGQYVNPWSPQYEAWMAFYSQPKKYWTQYDKHLTGTHTEELHNLYNNVLFTPTVQFKHLTTFWLCFISPDAVTALSVNTVSIVSTTNCTFCWHSKVSTPQFITGHKKQHQKHRTLPKITSTPWRPHIHYNSVHYTMEKMLLVLQKCKQIVKLNPKCLLKQMTIVRLYSPVIPPNLNPYRCVFAHTNALRKTPLQINLYIHATREFTTFLRRAA